MCYNRKCKRGANIKTVFSLQPELLKMKKLFKPSYIYMLIPTIFGIGICACAKYITGFADWYYINIYKPVAGVFGTLVGLIPISLMELGIFVCVICPPVIYGIRQIASKRKFSVLECGARIVKFYLTLICIVLPLCLTCSLNNYYRTDFADTFLPEGIEYQFSVSELRRLCEDLVDRACALGTTLEHGEDGTTVYSGSDYQMAKEAAKEYRRLYEKCPQLEIGGDSFGTPKPVICSFVMSKLLISGVFSPYTMEANICTEGPDFLRGSTMMHEQSHLRGYMNEAEANFIAFLACENSEDPYFEYSGTCSALIYAMNALYKEDYESWLEIRQRYSESLDADMKAQNAYVSANKGTVSNVSDKVNDTYLKINSQTDGVKSYSAVVNLLLAYWRYK